MIEYLDQRQWLKTGITFGTALAIAISFSITSRSSGPLFTDSFPGFM